ncbi:hypothetical protein JRO89_XS07G0280500 [Xanthoceras sorbifolium]|uniref:Reticulon-like protein n=1 Tax=Xanthoceras sorbifolium TaxID=99658 RepID=A0ABQ8HVK8_9ROSI|nr:hypothetical protein JRO89_XS07G0280500 [Xanthoceras sorbifolium]
MYTEPNISIDGFGTTDQYFKGTSESGRHKPYDHEGVEPNLKRICIEAKSTGLGALCAEPNITQPSISLEADTSARGSDYRSREEKKEPHPKSKSAQFINNKVSLLHHTLLRGVGLLDCYGWSFLVCFFGGLCVFGLLGLLVLHLSALCEIYLSYHEQNMQDNQKNLSTASTDPLCADPACPVNFHPVNLSCLDEYYMVIEIHEDDLDAEIPFNQEILPVVIGGFIDYPRLEGLVRVLSLRACGFACCGDSHYLQSSLKVTFLSAVAKLCSGLVFWQFGAIATAGS